VRTIIYSGLDLSVIFGVLVNPWIMLSLVIYGLAQIFKTRNLMISVTTIVNALIIPPTILLGMIERFFGRMQVG
jgi:hypothetical protein